MLSLKIESVLKGFHFVGIFLLLEIATFIQDFKIE